MTVGLTLAGRYRLVERIATGGMGEVWRGRDDLLDRDVAVKVLKAEYADDAAFRDRFRAEARHTAGLAHQGIAGVFDYGEEDGTAYLVMELVPGEPLSAILAREGRLPADRTLDVVAQAARALDAAHAAGVVHRDVKPGNILVCPDGTVKLTDFGIARAADATPLTRTGVVLGTAQYLSPEQGQGRPVTAASDVYSLGVVAYESLAGYPPFEADTPIGIALAHVHENPRPLPDDVPPGVAAIVAKALAKDPADRYADAAAFATIAEALRAEPTPTRVLPVLEEPVIEGPYRPSRQTVVVLVGVAIAVVLGLLAGLANRPGEARSPQPAPSRAVTPSGPQPVSLPKGLIGRPVADVAATLKGLGLTVRTAEAESDEEFGTVLAVRPSAGLHQGDTVTVTYSSGPDEGGGRKRRGKGHGD